MLPIVLRSLEILEIPNLFHCAQARSHPPKISVRCSAAHHSPHLRPRPHFSTISSAPTSFIALRSLHSSSYLVPLWRLSLAIKHSFSTLLQPCQPRLPNRGWRASNPTVEILHKVVKRNNFLTKLSLSYQAATSNVHSFSSAIAFPVIASSRSLHCQRCTATSSSH